MRPTTTKPRRLDIAIEADLAGSLAAAATACRVPVAVLAREILRDGCDDICKNGTSSPIRRRLTPRTPETIESLLRQRIAGLESRRDRSDNPAKRIELDAQVAAHRQALELMTGDPQCP